MFPQGSAAIPNVKSLDQQLYRQERGCNARHGPISLPNILGVCSTRQVTMLSTDVVSANDGTILFTSILYFILISQLGSSQEVR
jgi:hypothetical protein